MLLVLLGGALLWEMGRIDRSDYDLYERLIRSSDPSANGQEFKLEVRQTRVDNKKEAWWSRNHQRFHFQLSSTHSELVFTQQGRDSKTVEYLNGVHCAMQEELFFRLPDGKEVIRKEDEFIMKNPPRTSLSTEQIAELIPVQQIRTFDADRAVYHYRTQQFSAEQVDLARFTAPGQVLLCPQPVEKRIMSGLAQSIEFSVNARKPNFQAHHLKATFFSNKGML